MLKKNKKHTNPDTPKMCLYCENATIISDDDNVLCSIKGIVNKEYRCKKCIYDPLKRRPKKPLLVQQADPSDFEL